MMVDTVVKIVESEKCGIMTMNVGVNGVCNGYVKNNYVFVGNSNVALIDDDHASEFSVEEGASVKVNGDVESGVKVCGEGLKVENGSNAGEDSEEESREIKSEIEVAEVENGGSIRVLEVREANDSEPVVDEVQDAEQSRDGNLKASFSLNADAISVDDQSYDCQQQNLQPGDGEDDKQDLIEIQAKIDEIGEDDPVARSEESVDSKAAGCELDLGDKGDITGRICLEPFSKPEETPVLQSLCNQPEGASNQGNFEALGMEIPVSLTVGQFDESTMESVEPKASVPDNSACGFTYENKPGTETKNSEIGMAIKLNNISDGTLGLNFRFGSFECVAPFSHADINLQSDANSSEHKLNPDPCANDGPSDGSNHVYWLVKIPRADVRIYDEQIRQSEIELAEKTKTRNAFQVKANQQQAYCRELKNILEAAKVEAKAAYELARNKKRDVDFAHTIINQAKNGVTVEDLDSKILSLEHALQHETHNLRAERELVREIRQLSHQRKQLSANPQQQQQEIQQARNQRYHAEEQLKVLKKELDALRVNFVKADEHVRAAKKKHDDESAVLADLKCQVRSTNDIRQQAYVHLQTLKRQRHQKNAAFYQGKNDLRIAYNYAAEGKRDSLERHCANQVETFMEMWNKNDEFRKEYIQSNMRHKLWKQGLLDDTRPINEVPPSLEKFPDDRENASIKVDSPTAALPMETDISIEGKATKDKSPEKVEQNVAKKNEAISNRIEIEEYKEEPKLTNEEEELIKRENQLKREKEAAQLREQRRVEEKAKAEEALERKRQNALKAQARAEFKARKEAEQKEKEREKRRAKKKEKKRGLNPETPENEPAKPPEPLPESLNEPEAVEKSVTVAKRSTKASSHTKQIKLTKPIPVALRNKGKRRLLCYWPYACIVLIATVLIFLGSSERIQTIKQHISDLLHQ
ncbi:uncharacterized protein LOC141638547 [Silene latifolia]|uniref:uncharacterized protein LOC141638547 n=1 Tax=Silene latifolia TaxID=37657 RepID=UPI003D77CBCE